MRCLPEGRPGGNTADLIDHKSTSCAASACSSSHQWGQRRVESRVRNTRKITAAMGESGQSNLLRKQEAYWVAVHCHVCRTA